ncbi:hypothetical protein CAP36_12550 [Chitinophagaceae bacterium IBVUCB2]|nr:hypothetical protein CAP36_12550 [Chitinophagaceae bacterium IBVUCB2]
MNSEKFAVVFDTNSYRNLIRDTSIEDIEASIARLKEKEASKNIMAYATPVVGLELLGNLSGTGRSLHFDDCLKGLIAMANHCYEKTENTIHIVPYSYLHITGNFFDVSPAEVELISKNMAGVIGDFKEDYLKAIEGHQLNETFTKLKDYIDSEEPRWIREVESFVEGARREIIKLDPSIKPKDLRSKMLQFIDSGLFVPRISMAIIFSIAKSLLIKMTENEHVLKGYMLPRTFPLSVGFYQWICHRVVADNIDLKNKRSQQTRWNWRWDYEVSFLMNDHLLNGRIVLLVTSDKDMIKMLEKYGYGGRVMNLDKYLGFLDS